VLQVSIVTHSLNDKCEKIKLFMRLLAVHGFIKKTRSNQKNFELYCLWAGGAIARKGRTVLCVNRAPQP
jgi:hypothetical protein